MLIPHLGGTRALGVTVTMDARQGADLVELLKPPVTVPIHFDDYDRFKSPLGEFVAEVARRQLPGELRTVHRGDTISLRRMTEWIRQGPAGDLHGSTPGSAGEELVELLVALVDADLHAAGQEAVAALEGVDQGRRGEPGATVAEVLEESFSRATPSGMPSQVKVWTMSSSGRTSWKQPRKPYSSSPRDVHEAPGAAGPAVPGLDPDLHVLRAPSTGRRARGRRGRGRPSRPARRTRG